MVIYVVVTTSHNDKWLHKQVNLKGRYNVGSSQKNSTRVSAKLESYIYKVHMVHTTTLCLPYFLLKATMLYTCALTSSFRFFHHVLGLWCHIMWPVMWLQCHMPLHCSKEKQNQYKIRKIK